MPPRFLMYGAILIAATGAVATVPASAQQSSGISSADNGYELLPNDIDGVMVGPTDNECPGWNSTTQAKEIIVFLMAGSKSYADANRDIKANMDKGDPVSAAVMARNYSTNQSHIQAMIACRDAIAQQLGMNAAAVRHLYEYNTLTTDETAMFSELDSNYNGQPNYFANLLSMDHRKALHLIDLELKELDFSITQIPSESARDQEIISHDRRFRQALLAVRTAIVKKSGNVPSPASGSAGGRWPPPEHLRAIESQPLRDQYITMLRNKIQNAWIKPPSATVGVDCIVEVTQVPGGEVTGARVTQCNGDAAVRQSIENAVYRASPLPDPPDQALFDRNLRLNFRPTE